MSVALHECFASSATVAQSAPIEYHSDRSGRLVWSRLQVYSTIFKTLSEADYMDLTLKVYSEQIENGKRIYRLGWKRDNRSNPHVIKASRLIPKGKVIGVYRNLRLYKSAF